MTLEEFYNLEERIDRECYIVRLKYKYDHEEEYTIENQILLFEDADFIWYQDWNEGQTDVEVLGYIAVNDVAVNLFTGDDTKDADSKEQIFVYNPSETDRQWIGKWVDKEVRGEIRPCCSVCGEELDVMYHYNYCPNCGAKMEE